MKTCFQCGYASEIEDMFVEQYRTLSDSLGEMVELWDDLCMTCFSELLRGAMEIE